MNRAQKSDLSLIGLNRRGFLRQAGLISALSPMAMLLLGGENVDAALPPEGLERDIAILNFALNLEYLEGEYYTLGAYGTTLEGAGINTAPSGAAGSLNVKSNPLVPFTNPVLQQAAQEIARDEQAHINFIQATIVQLGGTPVSRPEINLVDSFNIIASSAGIAPTFDPFANEVNFFLGAYSLTDVGVTAYHGAAPLITNKTVLSGSAGILATEAYHDATLRLGIYQAGAAAQQQAQLVSNLRDQLDDRDKKDKDQGVTNADGTPNIVPADSNSIAYARTTRQVLNIVYGGFKAASGGFFPGGLNGEIK